jgi:SAM-dependent methyltransferase
MSPKQLDTEQYWDQRLAANLNLRGTGHRAFDMEYNRWLYQAQLDCLELAISRNGVDIRGRRVLDVGSGTGFFVECFQQHEAAELYGVDISETSTRYLQDTFPSGFFATYDISDADFPFEGTFELISVISVLYHIVDDDRFHSALQNICQRLSAGGYLLLSDTFRTPRLPTAKHARPRPLASYLSIFQQNQVNVLDTVPIYYYLNRTFIPLLGPRIVSGLKLGRRLYEWDRGLREKGTSSRGGMQLLLAQKARPAR